jgi:hypothetical protein
MIDRQLLLDQKGHVIWILDEHGGENSYAAGDLLGL